MKYLLLILIAFASHSAVGQKLASQDSVQILSVIEDWNQAWKSKDYALATRGYSPDARFTNAFGDKCTTQAAIQNLLKQVFSLPFVMAGDSETTEHIYQVLNEKDVIVHTAVVRKGQQMPDGSVLPDRQTTHLRVFQKAAERWEIKAHLISDARDKQAIKH